MSNPAETTSSTKETENSAASIMAILNQIASTTTEIAKKVDNLEIRLNETEERTKLILRHQQIASRNRLLEANTHGKSSNLDVNSYVVQLVEEAPFLTELNLRNQYLLSNRAFERVKHLTSLEFLDIGASITHEKRQIKHLKKLTALRKLHLDSIGIGDDDLKYLSDLKALETLNICGNLGITDEGMQHLLCLPALSTLTLNVTHVTDAGVVHLSSVKSLKNVYVDGSISDKAIAEFKEKLPECKIERWNP